MLFLQTGVGGWAESGINPAEYSRTFMRVACAYVEGLDTRAVATLSSEESSPCASLSSMDAASALSSFDGSGSPTVTVDPRGALDTAHKLTKVPGSATACVVQLCPEQRALIAANLVSLSCERLGQADCTPGQAGYGFRSHLVCTKAAHQQLSA